MDPADLIAREEDDVSLPRAALNKLIKDTVPEARLTYDARELMLKISHEFIHTLAKHANEACNQAGKKTMMADHVLEGLDMMGLQQYREQASFASDEARIEMKNRKAQTSKYKFQKQSEEDYSYLVELQQKLFEQARAQMEMESSLPIVDNNHIDPTNDETYDEDYD